MSFLTSEGSRLPFFVSGNCLDTDVRSFAVSDQGMHCKPILDVLLQVRLPVVTAATAHQWQEAWSSSSIVGWCLSISQLLDRCFTRSKCGN